MTTSLTHIRRYLLTALLLLPLLVMSVFPQGTMAARGAQGMEVVLCTGAGPLTILVDDQGTPIEDHQSGADCGWWMLGQSLCLTAAPCAGVPASTSFYVVATPQTGAQGPSQITSPYPARAPPFV